MTTSAPHPPGPPHSGPRRSASRRTGRRRTTDLWARLRQDPTLALILLMALVLPVLPGPDSALPWSRVAGAALEAGGVLLLAAALWRADAAGLGRALAFAGRGPTGWLLGFLAWAFLSATLSSGGTAALQGVLGLGAGLLVYATVAYRVRREADLRLALDAVSATSLLVSTLALGALLLTGAMSAGAFTHRSFGAVLALLFPIALLSAGAPGTRMQRGAGQAAAVLGLLALLLSHWNPAERGALVAALVLGLACWRLGVRVWPSGGQTLLAQIREARALAAKSSRASHPRGSHSGRRHSRAGAIAERRRTVFNRAFYGATMLVAAGVFLALTPDGGIALRHVRAGLTQTVASHPSGHAFRPSFSWAPSSGRLLRGLRQAAAGAGRGDTPEGHQSTRALLAMIAARPVQGWGLGCYALHQAAWTHQGDDEAAVRRHGPKPGDRARGAYWQTAAETGLIGLALWAVALTAFFIGAVRALRGTELSPLRRRVLIGCLAAVAGQAVEAYSDGSWQGAAPSLFLWLILGLGAAAAGGEPGLGAQEGGGSRPGQVGWQAHLRFAGVCALCAVLLSLVARAA